MSTPKTTTKRTAKRTAKKPLTKTATKAAKKPVSDTTLSRLPERVVSFLMGIGNIPDVRAKLATLGYNATAHQAGWTLLELVGRRASLVPAPAAPAPDEEAEQKNAAVEAAQQDIDAWASTNFIIASAALEHSFPVQHAYVFAEDLKAGQGPAAVLSTQTLLNRIERLGVKRRNSDPDDAKALALLVARGITEDERKRVRGLISTVQEGKAPAPSAPSPTPAVTNPDALVKLYAWYNEWTRIAHAVIKRRDHLVRLGLASLKRRPVKTA